MFGNVNFNEISLKVVALLPSLLVGSPSVTTMVRSFLSHKSPGMLFLRTLFRIVVMGVRPLGRVLKLRFRSSNFRMFFTIGLFQEKQNFQERYFYYTFNEKSFELLIYLL